LDPNYRDITGIFSSWEIAFANLEKEMMSRQEKPRVIKYDGNRKSSIHGDSWEIHQTTYNYMETNPAPHLRLPESSFGNHHFE
jgi:hypothetical protein